MIYLITGVPGSGKTYFSVNFIYEQLISKNPKYQKIFTNINLNFKKCDKIKKDFVKPLVLDDLLKRIEKDYILSEKFKNNNLFTFEVYNFSPETSLNLLKQMFKPKKKIITDYDSYVRGKLKLFEKYEHSLIILDECHLYFTESTDPKMLRFLSYHRHFDIDMYLITQNKSLINRKYLAFVENMYIGINPSKRLFSKVFVYKLYASWKEYKSNYVGKEKLKFDKKIAELYNSGSNKIQKTLVSKLLIPLFIALIILYFLYKGITNYISCGSFISCSKNIPEHINTFHSINKKNEIVKNEKKHTNYSYRKNVNDSSDDITDYQFFYKLYCFKLKCIVNNQFSVSYYLIKTLPKISDTKIFYEITTSYGKTLYLATNLDLSKFNPNQNAYGGKQDEKDNILPFNSHK
ncbi:zonular occludens toxin domain-containing protein [Nautilia sp.]